MLVRQYYKFKYSQKNKPRRILRSLSLAFDFNALAFVSNVLAFDPYALAFVSYALAFASYALAFVSYALAFGFLVLAFNKVALAFAIYALTFGSGHTTGEDALPLYSPVSIVWSIFLLGSCRYPREKYLFQWT